VGLAAEAGKSRLWRARGSDGCGDGGVGYAPEVFMKLFTGFDRENVIRKSDSVLIIAAFSSSDKTQGRHGRFFGVGRISSQ
jgi:hypothetical protein